MPNITAYRIGGTLSPYVDAQGEIEAADIRVTNWLVVPNPDTAEDTWPVAGPANGGRVRNPKLRADVFVDSYELVHGTATVDADGVPIGDGDTTKPTEQIWWTKKPLDLTTNTDDPTDTLNPQGLWYRIHVDVITDRTENGTVSAALPAGRHHTPLEWVADFTALYLLDELGDIVRVNAAGQRDPAGAPVLDIDKLLEEPPDIVTPPAWAARVAAVLTDDPSIVNELVTQETVRGHADAPYVRSSQRDTSFPHVWDAGDAPADAIQTAFNTNKLSIGALSLPIHVAAYHEGSDLGGGFYRVVDEGTGIDDGGAYIDFEGFQLEAVFGAEACVTRFGAKGDDVADDSGAFIAAAATNIPTITMPTGTFDLTAIGSGGLVFMRAIRLIGSGDSTVLRFAERGAGTGYSIVVNGVLQPAVDFIEFADFILDGGTDGDPRPEGPYGSAIRLNSAAVAVTRNVTIRNCDGFAFAFERCADAATYDCKALGVGRDGLHFEACAKVTIDGFDTWGTGDDSIAVLNITDQPNINGPVTISNFRLNNDGDHPLHDYNKGYGVRVGYGPAQINHGVVEDCHAGGVIVQLTDYGDLESTRAEDVAVDNVAVNRVGYISPTAHQVGDASGVIVFHADNVRIGSNVSVSDCRDRGVSVTNSTNVRIAAKVVDTGNRSSLSSVAGIHVLSGSDIIVRGAESRDNGGAGIRSAAACTDILIDGGIYTGNGQRLSGTNGSGATLQSDAATVRGATITGNNGYGIRAAGVDTLEAVGNDLRNNTQASLSWDALPASLVSMGNIPVTPFTPSNASTARTFDASTVTTAQLANVVATLLDDLGYT